MDLSFQVDYDVAVVGAGAAGVAAASAAADLGARVVLIESTLRLGGAVSDAMHRSLCGLYSQEPQDPLDTLNTGVQRDLIARMMRLEPASVVPRQMGKTWVLEFPAHAWESSLLEVCSKDNIDRLMECRVTSVRQDNTRITAIRVESAASSRWLEVETVIDCTGGGAVLQMAGEDVALPSDDASVRMLGGFSIRLAGLTGDLEILRLQTPYVLTKAVAAGTLPNEARFTTFQPGPRNGEGLCKLAVHPDRFSTEEVSLFATQIVEHLKAELPGFSGAQVVETSPRALARDGRRLRGRVIVTEEDVLQARQIRPDAIHAWWPIERWDVMTGPTYAYPPCGQHYDIPADALRSLTIENLFAAGTCVSATSGAAASIRASGICLATGDAAGRLAASLVAPSAGRIGRRPVAGAAKPAEYPTAGFE